jgi:hypothetical protein
MKNILKLSILGAILIAAPALLAQIPVASTLVLTEPTEVSGTVVPAGQYLIRILPSNQNRNQVQITSLDKQTVYATALTVPHPLEPSEEIPDTRYTFYPAGEGQPRALRTWWPADPPANAGQDFIYEESRAKQLARLAKMRVISYPEDTAVAELETAELVVQTPEATVEPYVYTPPVETQVTTTTTTTVETPVAEPVEVETERRMTTKD